MSTVTESWRSRRPGADEYAPFYAGYVGQVPDGDVVEQLERQLATGLDLFGGLSEPRLDHRYAPGKWSVRQVIGHVVDAERLFSFRALAFARGDAAAQPGMDQEEWMAGAGFERRSRESLLAEYEHLRRANLALFSCLDEAAFERRGVASGNAFTVRALVWIVAGHELHHRRVLGARYGVGEDDA